MPRDKSQKQLQEAEDDRFNAVSFFRDIYFSRKKTLPPGPDQDVLAHIEAGDALMERVKNGHYKTIPSWYDHLTVSHIEGELSALRWILGEEWGFLDT